MSDLVTLNSTEAVQLAAYEQTIKQGLATFVEVGAALSAIRDARLYRAEFGTFEEYCESKWGMSKRHCDRLIGASTAIENLGPMGPIPSSERVARPLTKLPPSEQQAAWQEAVDTAPDGKVTAKHVQGVIERRTTETIKHVEPAKPTEVQVKRMAIPITNLTGSRLERRLAELVDAARELKELTDVPGSRQSPLDIRECAVRIYTIVNG